MKDYGSIYLRKDGYYYGRVQYKKERKGFYSKSRKKVQKLMNYWVLERKYSATAAAFTGVMLLSEYCYCYLFVFKYGSINNSSFDRLMSYVKKYMDNSAIDVPVKELDVVVLQNYLEHVNLSNSSKVKMIGFVRAVLRYAYSRNDIDYDARDYLVFPGSADGLENLNKEKIIYIDSPVLNAGVVSNYVFQSVAALFYICMSLFWCRGSPLCIDSVLYIKGG